MTDSRSDGVVAVDERPGKRERLVAAASQLLYQQGTERTTLAEIAQLADVPAGNVYYYFKTKDEVVGAVIEDHVQHVKATLEAIDSRHRSPKARLKALVQELDGQSEMVARFGCPLGSLCSELDKRVSESDFVVGNLLRFPVDWAEAQFRALGRRGDAHDLALDLVAACEGHALLANTLRDPEQLARASRRIDRWIDSL